MMVRDAEFGKIWLRGSAVSSSAADRFGRRLAGLGVGLVAKAVVEEKVVKAVVEEEVVEACGLERVGVDVAGVVAGSQILSVGGGAEKLQGCPRESRQRLDVLMRRLEQPGAILFGTVDCGEVTGQIFHGRAVLPTKSQKSS